MRNVTERADAVDESTPRRQRQHLRGDDAAERDRELCVVEPEPLEHERREVRRTEVDRRLIEESAAEQERDVPAVCGAQELAEPRARCESAERRLGREPQEHRRAQPRAPGTGEHQREPRARGGYARHALGFDRVQQESRDHQCYERRALHGSVPACEPAPTHRRRHHVAVPGAPRGARGLAEHLVQAQQRDQPRGRERAVRVEHRDRREAERLRERAAGDDRPTADRMSEQTHDGHRSERADDQRQRDDEPHLERIRTEPDRVRREEALAGPDHQRVRNAVAERQPQRATLLFGTKLSGGGDRGHGMRGSKGREVGESPRDAWIRGRSDGAAAGARPTASGRVHRR